jgi:uncharacterized protein
VEEELEILGSPVLVAAVRSDVPVAFLSAKLCEVLDDGTSVLVSRGILNLTHRGSHSSPERLVPGESYEVTVELDATSWVFEAGHTLRIAIAGADWPNAWPPPEAFELAVDVGETRLLLPKVPGPSGVERVPNLAAAGEGIPEAGPDAEPPTWRIEHDVYGRQTRVVVHQRDASSFDGCMASVSEGGEVGVQPHAPGTAWVVSETDYEIEWPQVTARSIARVRLRSDPANYFFDLELETHENGALLASRRWSRVAPRREQ